MKKGFLMIGFTLFAFSLSACGIGNSQTTTGVSDPTSVYSGNSKKIDGAMTALAELVPAAPIKEDFILPVNLDGVSIRYVSENTAVINPLTTGYFLVTRPMADQNDAVVEITANFTYSTKSDSLVFPVTVLAEDNQTAAVVVALIANLPTTITLTDEALVAAVRASYEALNDAQKLLVTNYTVLTAAEAAIIALKGQIFVDEFEDAYRLSDVEIRALSDANFALFVAKIAACETAYNALPAAVKAYVDAEGKLASHFANLKILIPVNQFERIYKKIEYKTGNNVAISDGALIEEVEAAYLALSSNLKSLVDPSGQIVNHFAKLRESIEALVFIDLYQSVVAFDNDTKKVTLADEAVINSVIAAYEALPSNIAAIVNNTADVKNHLDQLADTLTILHFNQLYDDSHVADMEVDNVKISDKVTINGVKTALAELEETIRAQVDADGELLVHLNNLLETIDYLEEGADFITKYSVVSTLTDATVLEVNRPAINEAITAYGNLSDDAVHMADRDRQKIAHLNALIDTLDINAFKIKYLPLTYLTLSTIEAATPPARASIFEQITAANTAYTNLSPKAQKAVDPEGEMAAHLQYFTTIVEFMTSDSVTVNNFTEFSLALRFTNINTININADIDHPSGGVVGIDKTVAPASRALVINGHAHQLNFGIQFQDGACVTINNLQFNINLLGNIHFKDTNAAILIHTDATVILNQVSVTISDNVDGGSTAVYGIYLNADAGKGLAATLNNVSVVNNAITTNYAYGLWSSRWASTVIADSAFTGDIAIGIGEFDHLTVSNITNTTLTSTNYDILLLGFATDQLLVGAPSCIEEVALNLDYFAEKVLALITALGDNLDDIKIYDANGSAYITTDGDGKMIADYLQIGSFGAAYEQIKDLTTADVNETTAAVIKTMNTIYQALPSSIKDVVDEDGDLKDHIDNLIATLFVQTHTPAKINAYSFLELAYADHDFNQLSPEAKAKVDGAANATQTTLISYLNDRFQSTTAVNVVQDGGHLSTAEGRIMLMDAAQIIGEAL